jgi:hypothetical protein
MQRVNVFYPALTTEEQNGYTFFSFSKSSTNILHTVFLLILSFLLTSEHSKFSFFAITSADSSVLGAEAGLSVHRLETTLAHLRTFHVFIQTKTKKKLNSMV